MKKLDKDQKETIDTLTKEFIELNSMNSHEDITNLFLLIDSQINDKVVFKKNALAKTKAFEKVNNKRVAEILKLMNELLSKYGYRAELNYQSNGTSNYPFTQYYKIIIYWEGHFYCNYRDHVSETEILIYTDINNEYNVSHLGSTELTIRKGYGNRDCIENLNELIKYLVVEIIKKQQEKV
jgi:hypothetical protein